MTDPSRAPGDILDLLGLVGLVSLASVEWVGGRLADAPTVGASVEAVRLIGEDSARLGRVCARVEELGAGELAVLGGYDGLLDGFEARTVAGSWWEGLVKVYVTDGLLRDFCLLLAEGATGEDRVLVEELLAPSQVAGRMASRVADAAAADPVLASRLALWGRRIVGEGLTVVQALIERPGIARLLDTDPDQGHDQAWVFSRLTAEHTRRMGRLDLAA